MFFKSPLLFFFVLTIAFVNQSNSVPVENDLTTTNSSTNVQIKPAQSFNKKAFSMKCVHFEKINAGLMGTPALTNLPSYKKHSNSTKLSGKYVDCKLPPINGDGFKACMAYFIKYYFDHETNTCKTFVYGGCGGNANRFSSEKACLDACL